MRELERQGHTLYRREGPGEPVECYRLVITDKIRANNNEHPDIPGVEMNVDDPLHPYHHGDNCRVCNGTGLYRSRVTVAYECLGCNRTEKTPADFDDTCCLGLGPAFMEFRAEHEDGEHRWHKRPGCPLCIEERMARDANE